VPAQGRRMVETWYAIAALTVTMYVVMDGFDLGAGALHLLVARTDAERRLVLAAIGPLWDGNEVWLLATGGVLFLAFPKVLASALSGFYLAIFLVIWALVLRGAAIEFRSHVRSPLWRQAWDVVFSAASALLAVVLGAALGNVLRGVPLDERGWFTLSLFTDFTPSGAVGILDWYTVLVGVFAAVALAGHGASFLAFRTGGAVHDRSRRLAAWLHGAAVPLLGVVTVATLHVDPALLAGLPGRPAAWVAALAALAGLAAALVAPRRGRHGVAFLGSCVFLFGFLAATAALRYPVMLAALGDPARSLTAPGTAARGAGLAAGLRWWLAAFPLAIAYLAFLFRLHRGKAVAAGDGEGY
jgi:cytochrome d ubiquinol oxidase subunit II